MRDAKQTALELRTSRLVDDHILKDGGKREILAAIDRWIEKGLSAYVVSSHELSPTFRDDLWRELSASEENDLVLLFDGKSFEARGWGLDSVRIHAALLDAAPGLKAYNARGIREAIDGLGNAALELRTGPPRGGSPATSRAAPIVGGVAGLALIGGLGFVIARRNAAFKQQRQRFDEARARAEKTFSEVVLAAEELDSEKAGGLQLRAAELKTRIDAVSAAAEADASRVRDPVTVGQIEQLGNELAALHSETLQQRRG